jgi:precorrin-6A/cobalt-precorrin-6A reductase
MPARLLILGGTAEAAQLAAEAAAQFGGRLEVIVSLAGRLPERPPPAGCRVRRGGFGGEDGLAGYLADAGIDLLVDATHPFAATISRHAATACAAAAVARLLLLRPPWTAGTDDRWVEAADTAMAAALAPKLGRRVFLTTGPGSLAAFAPITAAGDAWYLVRLFEQPPAPLPLARYEVVVARPPFSVADEVALLSAHAIEVVVAKQSGGTVQAKLRAAALLRLPVVMIARPAKPAGDQAADIDGAMAWLAARLAVSKVRC